MCRQRLTWRRRASAAAGTPPRPSTHQWWHQSRPAPAPAAVVSSDERREDERGRNDRHLDRTNNLRVARATGRGHTQRTALNSQCNRHCSPRTPRPATPPGVRKHRYGEPSRAESSARRTTRRQTRPWPTSTYPPVLGASSPVLVAREEKRASCWPARLGCGACGDGDTQVRGGVSRLGA